MIGLPRFRAVTRRVPRTTWVQVFGSPKAETGKDWMYGGYVFRRCVRVPLVGYRIGVLVMPANCEPTTYTGARRSSYVEKFGEPHQA